MYTYIYICICIYIYIYKSSRVSSNFVSQGATGEFLAWCLPRPSHSLTWLSAHGHSGRTSRATCSRGSRCLSWRTETPSAP